MAPASALPPMMLQVMRLMIAAPGVAPAVAPSAVEPQSVMMPPVAMSPAMQTSEIEMSYDVYEIQDNSKSITASTNISDSVNTNDNDVEMPGSSREIPSMCVNGSLLDQN